MLTVSGLCPVVRRLSSNSGQHLQPQQKMFRRKLRDDWKQQSTMTMAARMMMIIIANAACPPEKK